MKRQYRGFPVLIAIVFLIGSIPFSVLGKASDIRNVPNGKKFSCALCHAGAKKTADSLTKFGKDYLTNGKKWDAAIAKMDSGDAGITNGRKMGDPDGKWKKGDPDPAL
jgi:hypothetical protein